MADHYLQFSIQVSGLTAEERNWLSQQLDETLLEAAAAYQVECDELASRPDTEREAPACWLQWSEPSNAAAPDLPPPGSAQPSPARVTDGEARERGRGVCRRAQPSPSFDPTTPAHKGDSS